ncbi:hypothetical protein [Peribacillus frigoritolerans]|uniref:hypothetical protein n=1 Tax=Peribacillus frigoritolerans TaxID=450367 RepID=UPI00315DF808
MKSFMAQMHYGSFVYVVKAYLHGKFTLSDEEIKSLIEATWNSVSARELKRIKSTPRREGELL